LEAASPIYFAINI